MNHVENLELLKLYEGLRVADIRDGMDWVGYHHYGSVDPKFRPLFTGPTVIGIAKTARFLPYEGPSSQLSPEEYTEWVADQLANPGPAGDFWSSTQPGDFMCLDLADTDVGMIGSANSLWLKSMGCVGYLLNGAARDIDEIILQKIPTWPKFVAQTGAAFRVEFCEADVPIAIGGVAIRPGDIVAGDSDGVIIVPRKIARDVEKWARKENIKDRADRKHHYTLLGMELDETVI